MTLGLLGSASHARAEGPGSAGLRLGAGTDVSGGVAYGGQLDYVLHQQEHAFEIGLAIFGGEFEEESEEGTHTYRENTRLLVVGVLANYLTRYGATSGPYFVTGIGFGSMSAEWEERSATDTSLGTPLPGGGSMQAEDAGTAGMILNLGLGVRFGPRFDLRAQAPTFFIPESGARGSLIVPTLTLMAGIRFS